MSSSTSIFRGRVQRQAILDAADKTRPACIVCRSERLKEESLDEMRMGSVGDGNIGSLAYEVVISQALSEELKAAGVHVQVVCPGVVATEFHERQGLDMNKVPRMSAEDVVAASLKGLERGEVVCAPGVERSDLLEAVFSAELSVFGAQSPVLATRYQQQ